MNGLVAIGRDFRKEIEEYGARLIGWRGAEPHAVIHPMPREIWVLGKLDNIIWYDKQTILDTNDPEAALREIEPTGLYLASHESRRRLWAVRRKGDMDESGVAESLAEVFAGFRGYDEEDPFEAEWDDPENPEGLGFIAGVGYCTHKAADGNELTTYFHSFGWPLPWLVRDGRNLYITGGSFVVRDEGITG